MSTFRLKERIRRGLSSAVTGAPGRVVLAIAALAISAAAGLCGEVAAAPASPLDSLRFLVGTWRGESAGEPGQGSGTATFAFELDGRVLVRRGRTEFPAATGKPAIVHEDLMVIHAVPGTRKLEADYFDNEGHVIKYTVEVSRDGQRAVFSSEPEPSSPTFRLTYARVDENTVDVTFEIAPPGSPGAFKAHVSGRTRRVAQR